MGTPALKYMKGGQKAWRVQTLCGVKGPVASASPTPAVPKVHPSHLFRLLDEHVPGKF